MLPMRVLFDHPYPFMLAHGGFQTQIEQTRNGLQAIGVEVEYLRWWDDRQRGDLIHYFGTASQGYLQQARVKELPVVMTTLFTETCNRSDAQLRRQGRVTQTILKLPLGEGIKQQLSWRAYNACTLNIVGLEAERNVLEWVYNVPREKVGLVPLGLSDTFLQAGPGARSEPYLITTGTITPRKNSVELAEFAIAARVPVLFVGKPYSESDPYWRRFASLIDNQFVRYQPHVSSEPEMIRLLQGARGFVLTSWYENWCLSAHEAIACGLPVLVPDQKWSRERFADQARYFDVPTLAKSNVAVLRRFYDECPSLPAPAVELYSWRDVATRLQRLYAGVDRS